MDIEKLLTSPSFKKGIVAVGAVLVLLIIFQAGVYVGARKASFEEHEGNAYFRAIGGEPGPFGKAISAEGAAGKVLSVALPTFVVADRDNTEKVIAVGDGSDIRIFHDATSSGAIAPGQFVIVIGEPDENGEIHASFIRILPPPGQ
jgi:hypothetical protein